MRPIIGITGNTMSVQRPADVDTFHINYSPRQFTTVVDVAGGLPFIIPITKRENAENYIQQIDGLLLAGGQDVSPHLYGEEPRKVIQETSPERDANELALINAAIKYKKPILAVCRGMQLMNVRYGGSLYQDLEENTGISLQHVQRSKGNVVTHNIEIDADSHLASIMGETTKVNSFHHQVIKELGDNLTITAKSTDNVIEAFESVDDNIVAVQWHPELTYENDKDSFNLFYDLVERASNNRKQ